LPLRVAALRRISREIVEAARLRRREISRTPCSWTRSNAISSRSAIDKYLLDKGSAERLNSAGGIPPASRNQRLPTGCDAPAFTAAASLLIPAATYSQNMAR
jgi:hypothetical protein